MINYRTAGKHCAVHVKEHRFFLIFPVEKIRAHSVTPMHVAPQSAVGIVLVEKVVLSTVKAQTVRIVDPAALRCKVQLRAQDGLFRCKRRHGILKHRCKCALRLYRDSHCLTKVIAQVGIINRICVFFRINGIELINRCAVFRKSKFVRSAVKFHRHA